MVSLSDVLSSNAYATFVVGFAIMTDSMIYTLALPFLPDLFTERLHVPEHEISQWLALAFEVFALSTLLSNLFVGFVAGSSTSTSRPFMLSVVIMLSSTIIFFLGTTPIMILVSRVIQGASTTFTWVTGLAYLADVIGEGDLGPYVGWTTVGVAVGEIVGPIVGGPIYDYLGHWAAFGIVQSLLLVDILLRPRSR
ncbi:MFS general substrate transporter [Periconia macrospinosa]|uniref:MFS general substrate transporter n=1 Tax=Periconia macrospinosa TaxID=97972 RepID=A0A2V1E255_9PLEO|nr:MFS general substrate transporter [Periconia macrospinosa]